MTEASPIPPPRSDDDEDVHWALSTASALWARGDTGEALKWLRRAAETASDQNRDQRSLELFKAAADATSLLGGRGSGSVPAPPGHGHVASNPPGASASHPPPRTSATPPAPRSATPPPPRVSATPPPPRVSAAPPGSSTSTPPPLGSAAPPPRLSATPAPPQVGPAARPSALPSASTPRPPSAVPAPIAAARAVLKGKETASQRPSGAVTRKRKNTLDERFQFPDEEVTQQRDMRSLDRSRPAVQPPAPPPDDAAVSAMAPTAPQPSGGSAGGGAPVSRTSGATAAAARTGSAGGLRGSPSNTPAAGPLHATTTRTILSAGTSPRPSGVQPAGSPAASAAARAMSRQPTRKIDTTPPPVDDLDEQTSVLSGDEAELDFDGSATGENPVEDPRTVHDESPDALPLDDDGREATPEATPGISATDEPPHAPSIRPQPIAEVVHAGAVAPVAAWPTMRVALRREAGGVRIEALGVQAPTPPGAVAALLVAHDPASAEALVRLLEPR